MNITNFEYGNYYGTNHFKDVPGNLYSVCSASYSDLLKMYTDLKSGEASSADIETQLRLFTDSISDRINSGFSEKLLLDEKAFTDQLVKMTVDKMRRTVKNEQKAPFTAEDLKSNLLTGFTSGYYRHYLQYRLDAKKAYQTIRFFRIIEQI